jgi:hypothetical protein
MNNNNEEDNIGIVEMFKIMAMSYRWIFPVVGFVLISAGILTYEYVNKDLGIVVLLSSALVMNWLYEYSCELASDAAQIVVGMARKDEE